MQRRQFLATSLASSALAFTGEAGAQFQRSEDPEYYQLRRYALQTGPQTKLVESFFAEAMLPALRRNGMGPVGAFRLDIGQDTPSYYLLIPSKSLDDLATLDLDLARDETFMKAAAPFWSAPATAPAFLRVESSLLSAFPGWPRLTPPASAAKREKRIFQMRTYESPSYGAHVRKVEMFHSGEFEIFKNAGFHPVFFGDTLVGTRIPCLTYMLSFADMTELNAQWDVFREDPEWKKLSGSPRYGSEAIVSSISNVILSPLSMSQI